MYTLPPSASSRRVVLTPRRVFGRFVVKRDGTRRDASRRARSVSDSRGESRRRFDSRTVRETVLILGDDEKARRATRYVPARRPRLPTPGACISSQPRTSRAEHARGTRAHGVHLRAPRLAPGGARRGAPFGARRRARRRGSRVEGRRESRRGRRVLLGEEDDDARRSRDDDAAPSRHAPASARATPRPRPRSPPRPPLDVARPATRRGVVRRRRLETLGRLDARGASLRAPRRHPAEHRPARVSRARGTGLDSIPVPRRERRAFLLHPVPLETLRPVAPGVPSRVPGGIRARRLRRRRVHEQTGHALLADDSKRGRRPTRATRGRRAVHAGQKLQSERASERAKRSEAKRGGYPRTSSPAEPRAVPDDKP